MKSSDGGTVLPRDGAETEHLAHLGGLARTLFRLARERFTGVLYAESKTSGGVFSLREGRAVFFEDLREGRSVPDLLLELGLIDKHQYAEIAAEAINSASDSEDAAFCQHAVKLGIVSQEQIDTELGRRIRQRFVQAIGWEGCRIELDPDPESLTGILEYPQALGPLVYMGIRTFFGEGQVEAVVPPNGDRYVRLLVPEREAIDLFELEDAEAALLGKLRGDLSFANVVAQSGSDPLEVGQLVCALVLAQLAEVSSVPFANRSRGERRPERSGEHRTGPLGRYSAGGVREERVHTGPLSRPLTPPPGTAIPTERRVAKRSTPRMPTVQEERVGPLHPLLRDSLPAPNAVPASHRSATRHSGPLVPEQGRPEPPGMPRASEAQPAHRAAASASDETSASASRVVPPPGTSRVLQSRELRRPRTLGAALQRLDRELKQRQGAASPTIAPRAPDAKPPAAGVTMAPPASSGARMNVENLMRMRRVALDQRKAQDHEQAAGAKVAGDAFRAGQEALRLQKFPRAHELFSKACAADPAHPSFTLYCQYAAFRANLLSEEDVAKLRVALRDKIADTDLRAFAYHALGHIALVEKKDDVAEKCFLRATEFDKENEDAERHLRILELRRKHAEQEKGGSIFGKR